MSYSYYMNTQQAPDFHKLLDDLRKAGSPHITALECQETEDYPPLGATFPEDYFYHFYLFGISTRSVEVGFDDGSFSVRIMTCSCSEDYDLALQFIEAACKQFPDVLVEGEDRDAVTLTDLKSDFDDWAKVMIESGATFIPAMLSAGDTDGPLTLPGPVRDFHIGDRVLAELNPKDENGFPERLFQKIREVRYVDPEEMYFHANMMQIEDTSTGEKTTIAAWGPGVDYIFPAVEQLVLLPDMIHIPFEAADKLTTVTYLDERQIMVDAIPDEDWEEMVTRAAPYSEALETKKNANSHAPNATGVKKWWQFWK